MERVRVERGELSDYDALAGAHYRAGRPAVPLLTLRAECDGRTAGAAVIAAPVLNAPWRLHAWPGWLDNLSKKEAAHAVNARIRCIARLAVAPPFRGRSVGLALVQAYLADPLTDRTEALAAMGALCPVFERAGMRQVEFPVGRAVSREQRVLRAQGVPVWALADGAVRRRLSHRPAVRRAFNALAWDRWRDGHNRPALEVIDRLWVHVASRAAVFVAG